MPTYTASTLFGTTVAGDGALTSDEITDSTAPGRTLLTAATPADQRLALGITSEADQLLLAANDQDARAALGITTDGSNLITTTLAGQRVILGLNWGGTAFP